MEATGKPSAASELSASDSVRSEEINPANFKDRRGTTITILDPAAEALKKEKRESKPLRFIEFMTKHIEICFGIFLAIHISFCLITGILLATGYDIIPFAVEKLPLDIRDDVDYLHQIAWKERNHKDNNILVRSLGEAIVDDIPTRSEPAEFVDMIFRHKTDGNLLNAANLKKINETEHLMYDLPDYKDKYCLLQNSTGDWKCSKPNSIIRFFDGTYGFIPEDREFENIPHRLFKAYSVPTLRPMLANLLSKDYVITATEASSFLTRSSLALGGPLEGDLTDEETEEKYKEFLFGMTKTADPLYEDGVGDMNFSYNSMLVMMVLVINQVNIDMLLIVGSFVFIGLFMGIHTRSFTITFLSIFSIVACFFESNFIYRVILQYQYFGIFHVLSMFIILGIGADDIFIFIDTWRDSENYHFVSLAHRMSYVYRKAAMAMLFTSMTTAIAFFVSASSPFLGVFSFGMFSGLLIIVNYISVITFLPAVILLLDKYCADCLCAAKKDKLTSISFVSRSFSPATRHEDKPLVVRFFRRPYYAFVTHPICKWVIVVFFVGVVIASGILAARLEVAEERPNFFGDNTNIGQYINSISDFESSSSGKLTRPVFLVFGIKSQDISGCHVTDPDCFGVTTWDDDFSLESEEAQNDILQLCNELINLDDNKIDELHIQRDLVTEEPMIKCFISEMAGTTYYRTSGGPTHPFNQQDWDQLKVDRSDIYTDTSFSGDFQQYFPLSMGYWLYDEFNGTAETLKEFGPLVGEVEYDGETKTTHPTLAGRTSPSTIYYGNKLKYAAIRIDTELSVDSFGYRTGLPVREKWDDFISEKLEAMSAKDKIGGFQNCELWHWFKVQKRMVSSAITGIAIGLSVALPILIVATSNWMVGLLATLNICCITLSVVAVIPLGGWKLGLMESLNMVLVVGLAVDYVVHLAEGYARSSHRDRMRRTRDALEEVGVSVISGAATTLGASFFMLFAVIAFFTQFGVFVFSTIGFSVCYSLLMFITLLGIIGPEGDAGSIKPVYAFFTKCFNKCFNKKNNRDETLEGENMADLAAETEGTGNGAPPVAAQYS